MNALRIRKRLDSPIPQLPELTPLIGRELEIIVLDASDGIPAASTEREFWQPRSLDELAASQGVGPITSLEQLRGKEVGNSLDGFDEAVDQWRREPWRSEGE